MTHCTCHYRATAHYWLMRQSRHARSIFQLHASNKTHLVEQQDGEERNGTQAMEEKVPSLTHEDNANLIQYMVHDVTYCQ